MKYNEIFLKHLLNEPLIEIFSSCEDIRNVAVCKETFNLLFYESEGAHDVPDWDTRNYRKVDTIAADSRFRPGELKTNKETREIGPLTKKGLVVAIQVNSKQKGYGLMSHTF